MLFRVLYIFALSAVLCSCSSGSGHKAADASASSSELPLPEVPPTLTDPAERADYIMIHFWDKMDSGDTVRSHDKNFMELNIVNFISLFRHGSDEAISRGIGSMLAKVASDSVALTVATGIIDRYLDDPNSPMLSEPHYILYLEELLRLPELAGEERIRPAYKLEMARKNRPGTVAADFAYVDRNGRRYTLRTTPAGKYLLLIFYDPECAHCMEILKQVSGSEVITQSVRRGYLTVLAVYTEGNRKLWDATKASMPREWIVGFDADSIVDRATYSIPAMPVMYLLKSDKKVLKKDIFLPDVEDLLMADAEA